MNEQVELERDQIRQGIKRLRDQNLKLEDQENLKIQQLFLKF